MIWFLEAPNWGHRDSTVAKAFPLHAANPGFILTLHMVWWAPPGMSPGHRARSSSEYYYWVVGLANDIMFLGCVKLWYSLFLLLCNLAFLGWGGFSSSFILGTTPGSFQGLLLCSQSSGLLHELGRLCDTGTQLGLVTHTASPLTFVLAPQPWSRSLIPQVQDIGKTCIWKQMLVQEIIHTAKCIKQVQKLPHASILFLRSR